MTLALASLPDLAAELNAIAPSQDAAGRLASLCDRLDGRIVFTTSFGLEDQVLTHLIAAQKSPIQFATLDTGRLFPQTYDVWAQSEARYGVRVQPFYPQAEATEAVVAKNGINGFYDSVEARKACCGVRKVEPLARALAGAQGWVAGLRADQSAHRGDLEFVTFDAERGLIKLSPLFDWTRERARVFAADNDVPVNALHAKGFLSIGCAPCTRAVAADEPERAGRWWWEEETKRECGLHVGADGRLTRSSGAPQT